MIAVLQVATPAMISYWSCVFLNQSYRCVVLVSKCNSASIQWQPVPKVMPSQEIFRGNRIRLTVLNLHEWLKTLRTSP